MTPSRDTAPVEIVAPARSCAAAPLPASAQELLDRRWRMGRAERGLAPDAPFAWDRPERVGLDELEELADAAIYRRERYRCWYGRDPAAWPEPARLRMDAAVGAIEDLLAELRCGPLGRGAA